MGDKPPEVERIRALLTAGSIAIDPRIERIAGGIQGEGFTFWSIVQQREEDLEETISEMELAVRDALPEIELDCNVLYLRGRDVERLLSPELVTLYRRSDTYQQ